jgi:hypothetical protein
MADYVCHILGIVPDKTADSTATSVLAPMAILTFVWDQQTCFCRQRGQDGNHKRNRESQSMRTKDNHYCEPANGIINLILSF